MPISQLMLEELSYYSTLRVRASTCPINLLAREPIGKVIWFYVRNLKSPLPERTPGAPKALASWMSIGPGGSQVDKLCGTLERLKKRGVTGGRGTIVYSFLGRRVQLLQRRIHPGFKYEGLEDPSRFYPEKINYSDLFKRCCKLLDDFDKVPAFPMLFNAANLPENT
jgi:hypothetical protein